MRLWAVLVAVALVAGCTSTDSGGPATIRVPGDAKTISEAVKSARDGDLVLVSPGTYRETVTIDKARLVLRGTDRNGVVVDGEVRRANGIVVTAPGVAVENLTVRDNTGNGLLFTGMVTEDGALARGSAGYTPVDPAKFPPLQGFRASYITATNNGLYGIYAFDAQHGVIDNSYTSGGADSGIYVGQCKPCDITVVDNVAERNAVGYEGTNASGDMWVLRNRFVGNRVGATMNSDYQEAFVPQTGATFVGNLVAKNAEQATPAQADGGWGLGLGIAGGQNNTVRRNMISANPVAGIVLASAEDVPPVGNELAENTVLDNGIGLAYTATVRAMGSANCVRDTIPVVRPEGFNQCGDRSPGAGVPLTGAAAPKGVPFTDVAAPPSQPNMPDAATAPPRPAVGLTRPVDPAAVPVPTPDLLAAFAGVRL